MKLRRLLRVVGGAVAVALLAFAWRAIVLIRMGPARIVRAPAARAGVFEVKGVFHVHTKLSHDGRADVPEIVDAAKKAGLDFVYLTEHNNFGIAPLGQEGWKDGVLVLSGDEAGACDSLDPATKQCSGGHELLLGPAKIPEPLDTKSSEELANLVNREGGLAFAAHPGNRRVPWKATEAGLNGAELVSLWSCYKQLSWGGIIPAVLAYAIHPVQALNAITLSPGPDPAVFDAMSRKRRLTAIAGADAHAFVRLGNGWSLPLPSMQSVFRVLSTHLLLASRFTHRADPDRKLLLGALSKGHAYLAWDALADPAGFTFYARARDSLHPMGSVLPGQLMTLQVEAPEVPGVRIELLRDGQRVAWADGASLAYQTTEEGAYRCEVWLPYRTPFLGLERSHPWILSNPIYVGERYLQ